MSDLTLISHHLCPYVQRAVITLLEKQVPHERVYIDLADKPDWFAAISPLGKVPVLKTGDGAIFESAVIAEYLDETLEPRLHPADPLERARHRSWIEFGSAILNDIAGLYGAKEAAGFEAKRQALVAKFARLEEVLSEEGPYFSGERFHLVDAVYGPVFRYFDVFDRIADFGVFDGLPKVQSYRAALAARPSVRQGAPADYPERLWAFLEARRSYLSSLMTRGRPALAS